MALTSSPFVRLPHGYQNGVLLPHVAAFNEPALRPQAAAEIAVRARVYERIGFGVAFAEGELSGAPVGRTAAPAR